MTEGKIRSRPEAVAWRNRAQGIVVLTNGVFDLLHPGHVRVLEEARAQGDHLIVAVNTDASARGLSKGPGQPIVDERARARVIAAVAAVDCVVLFPEPTPAPLVAAVRPDVLVKGSDYDRCRIPGGEFVEQRGGRVVCVPLVEGYSTTSMVERIRDAT